MKIEQKKSGSKLVVTLRGFLDTLTSPELEKAIQLEGVNELVLNLKSVEYVSSAGLRVILSFHKKMVAMGGKLVIKSLTPAVKEIFDMVGYSAILNVE